MTPEVETVLEGTWEEILAHAGDLEGRDVEVKVYETLDDKTDTEAQRRKSLAAADRFLRGDFPPEERAALDEMDEYLKAHRFTLRPPECFEAAEGSASS